MIGDVAWQPLALRKEAGDFVAGFADWRWYGTLTFKGYVSEAHARRALKVWSRDVAANEIHGHFSLAYTVERTKGAGIWHHHVLLGVPTPSDALVLNAARVERRWKQASFAGGFTRLEPYRLGGGAAAYLTKTYNYALGTVCPRYEARCRREGGCPDGTSPWW